MIDRIKFCLELANELNKNNFFGVGSTMLEYACAAGCGGVQCGQENMLADVYSLETNYQYSVKSYRDSTVLKHFKNGTDSKYTPFIVERRVQGVTDPSADSSIVLKEVFDDIYSNAERSAKHYGVDHTSTVLCGFEEDDKFFYFRLNEYDYSYSIPEKTYHKYFTEKSSNFNKHQNNISCTIGADSSGTELYMWVNPNNQTFTRCLKKRYSIDPDDTFYFKIEKSTYKRPSDEELMSKIILGGL